MDEMKYFTKKSMEPIFEVLDKCKGVKQMEKYHPEGDVLTHTIQVFNKAFRETRDIDLLLACLLHDVGKRIDRRNHVKESLNLTDNFASCKTKWLIKNHMRVWTYINGEMRKLSRCIELAEHPWFPELIQLARFDKIGRIKNYKPKYDKDVIISKLNKAYDEHWQGEDPFPKKAEIVTPFPVEKDVQFKKFKDENGKELKNILAVKGGNNGIN